MNPPGSSSEPGGTPAGSSGGQTIYYASIPGVALTSGGQTCVSTSTFPFTSLAAAQAFNSRFDAMWAALLSTYKLCSAYPGGQAPNMVITPSILAAQYWQANGQNLLPIPKPYIGPGYALTGKRAYLETNSPLADTFTDPTPAGTLTIAVHGQFYVDWGDGTPSQGPFAMAGAAYPNGQITHVWDRIGSYRVGVSERWTATWNLAGQSGGLTGLSTQGLIPAFPVKQVESIINR
ncbi:MAG: hypothetical protein ACYCS7_04550 [Acidimicrobiales bacterium]